MIRSLWSAASGMTAQQLNIDIIANNLANVNTSGFKRVRLDFQDLLYQTLKTAGTTIALGAQVPTGIQVGHGSRAVATQKIFSQGDFIQTENPLDMVIEGDGFFQVLLPDGTIGYTRSGGFKEDGQGRIVTSEGFIIQPEIVIPNDALEVSVGTDGTVEVKTPGQSQPQQVGNIQLVRFANPAGLENEGRSIYKVSQASGPPTTGTPGLSGLGSLQQGFLEMSNVKVVEEMVSLIAAQRAYEISSKVIQATDEMLTVASNLRR